MRNRLAVLDHPRVYLSVALLSIAIGSLITAVNGVQIAFFYYPLNAEIFRSDVDFEFDPLLSQVLPRSFPFIFRVVSPVYDVPFAHLALGLANRAWIAGLLWLLAKQITGSYAAATLTVLAIHQIVTPFGAGPLAFLPSTPLGTASDYRELISPMYISFRQVALGLALPATLLLLHRRFVLSAVALGIALYSHPMNAMAFFVLLVGALPFVSMLDVQPGEPLRARLTALGRDASRFVLPFILTVLPYAVLQITMFEDVSPISVDAYWQFILRNEPDDVSTRYIFANTSLFHAAFGLVVLSTAGIVWLGRRHDSRIPPWVAPRGGVLLPLLWVPVVMVAFSYMVEGFYGWLPDLVSELLIAMQLHRMSSLAALFGTIGGSWLVVHVARLAWGRLAPRMRWSAALKQPSPGTAISGVALVLLAVAAGNLVVSADARADIGRHIDLSKQLPAFFLAEDDDLDATPLIYPPFMSVGDVARLCDWVRSNTPSEAAFFNPPYIKEFRTACFRQGFLEEKFDGNVAFTNRKYATVYLERFDHLLSPLSYDNLPGIVFEGGAPYDRMRERYLAIAQPEVEALRAKYPGYTYWLTEPGQELPYRVAYRDDVFVVYDLGRPADPR